MTVSETDWVKIFWELVRDSHSNPSDPYLDDTVCAVLGKAIGRPGCVAWARLSGFNKLEAYVFDTARDPDESAVVPMLSRIGYTKLTRPTDPSDIDWVVEFTPRQPTGSDA